MSADTAEGFGRRNSLVQSWMEELSKDYGVPLENLQQLVGVSENLGRASVAANVDAQTVEGAESSVESGQEICKSQFDGQYLRPAGYGWVDEADGTVVIIGAQYDGNTLARRGETIFNPIWIVTGVSSDGKKVELQARPSMSIGGGGHPDYYEKIEISYQEFRDKKF